MSIFFWFLIIAVATLALNTGVILWMRKQQNVRVFPVFVLLIIGYIAAALLYLLTAMQGTQILEQKQAVSLSIETQSYRTASDGTRTSYAFCSTEGIEFHLDDTELLTDDVPANPSVIEVYHCKVRTGWTGCYLSEDSGVYYILK